MIAAGASDQQIADRIGGLSRMAVSRHRRTHVMLPASALVAAVARASATEREVPRPVPAPVAASPNATADAHAAASSPAAPAGTAVPATTTAPQDIVNAALGAPRQAEKLIRIEDRLERMAALAEANGSPGQVATIATAQLRAVETGARLAGVAGYALQKAQGAGDQPAFVVNFHFSGGRTESLAFGAPAGQPHTIDGEAERAEDGDAADAEGLDDVALASFAKLAAAFQPPRA